MTESPKQDTSTPEGDADACSGCGLVLPASDGPTHPYMVSSAACWALYGEILAREYSNPGYFGVHQLTVDTYAVQHPGVPERRSIKSIGLHLMTLCLFLERGMKVSEGPKLHKRLVDSPLFYWLEPPEFSGRMTVVDVLTAGDASEHHRLVRAWAQDVWDAWAPHHSVVRKWVDQSLS